MNRWTPEGIDAFLREAAPEALDSVVNYDEVLAVIEGLPKQYRYVRVEDGRDAEILYRRFVLRETYDGIGKRVGLSHTRVWDIIRLARRKLRYRLGYGTRLA